MTRISLEGESAIRPMLTALTASVPGYAWTQSAASASQSSDILLALLGSVILVLIVLPRPDPMRIVNALSTVLVVGACLHSWVRLAVRPSESLGLLAAVSSTFLSVIFLWLFALQNRSPEEADGVDKRPPEEVDPPCQ